MLLLSDNELHSSIFLASAACLHHHIETRSLACCHFQHGRRKCAHNHHLNEKGVIMSDQVVLITGALTGNGRATALIFAQQGARVVVSGRRVSYHISNVPVLSTIEMSPGFGFTPPRR